MKNLCLLIFFFLISIINCTSLKKHNKDIKEFRKLNQDKAERNDLENDPRKYVTIYELRQEANEINRKLLWNWEGKSSFQASRIVDIDGEIQIEFDKDLLQDNTDFRGDFSIGAEISGEKGFRKIEVLPYTEVGKDEVSVGLSLKSSTEISSLFLNLLFKVNCLEYQEILSRCARQTLSDLEAESKYWRSIKNDLTDDFPKLPTPLEYSAYNGPKFKTFISDYYIKRDSLVFYSLYERLENQLNILNEDTSKSNDLIFKPLNTILIELKDKLRELNGYYSSYIFELKYPILYDLYLNKEKKYPSSSLLATDLKRELKLLVKQFDKLILKAKEVNQLDNEETQKHRTKSFLEKLKSFNNSLSHLEFLFSEFNKVKLSAKSAFLSTAYINNNQFNESHKELQAILLDIEKKIEAAQNDEFLYTEEIESKWETDLTNNLKRVKNAFDLVGTIVDEKAYESLLDSDKHKLNFIRSLNVKGYDFEPFYLVYQHFRRDTLIENVAREANIITLNNTLRYATIDLHKSGVKEGETLYLTLKHYSEKTIDPNENPNLLSLGRYEPRTTGWTSSINDSFLLVQRLNQPSSNQDSTVSPSNFKGAPGVSFMFTYRNDGDKSSYRKKLINFIEPSIGVNVSYIDFSIEKDLEIGAGLILGLFNKTIFLNGGVNLNGLSFDDDYPFYVGLGFSFLSLADKFSN